AALDILCQISLLSTRDSWQRSSRDRNPEDCSEPAILKRQTALPSLMGSKPFEKRLAWLPYVKAASATNIKYLSGA
ncbi:MAG TPA: hypothetical protein VLA17_16280, partial [Candidatus Limnocylindria bacterium]|nr:hypothetical protein [Candidatus Limnocylindria bacterium]